MPVRQSSELYATKNGFLLWHNIVQMHRQWRSDISIVQGEATPGVNIMQIQKQVEIHTSRRYIFQEWLGVVSELLKPTFGHEDLGSDQLLSKCLHGL